MSGISLLISTVDAKVAKLIQHGDALKLQLEKQEVRYTQLQEELSDKNRRISQLEEEIRNLQHEKPVFPSGNGKVSDHQQETKLRINELVREIDKCIALLNR